MKLKLKNYNTIMCIDEELEMIQKAMDYYTQNIIHKKSEGKDPDHPDVIRAIKYEVMCEALGIDGYGFT